MYDLHIHTNASDGVYRVEDICDMAVQGNLKTIAITDHDTTDSIEIAKKYCENKKLNIIPGIEITCEGIDEKEIHIIGLNIDTQNERLKNYCNFISNEQNKWDKKMIQKFNDLGVNITEEDVYKKKINKYANKRNYFEFLIENGYAKDQEDSFVKYFKTDNFKELKKDYYKLSTKEAIDIIHESGGIAILAHYQRYKTPTNKLLKKLSKEGIDGMECYHGKMNSNNVTYGIMLAKKYNLKMSIGSDFHGCGNNKIIVGKGIDNILLKANSKYCKWIDSIL